MSDGLRELDVREAMFEGSIGSAPITPIKVIHLITSLNVGGAERMLLRLVTEDRGGPIDHRVVTLTPNGALCPDIEAAGIPVANLGIKSLAKVGNGLFRLANIIKAERPAVVHSWLYHADLIATLALAISGCRKDTRLVWGIRCSDMDMRHYPYATRLILRLLPSLSPRADLVLCNSEAGRMTHLALGYHPSRWRIIPNGLDLNRFAPLGGRRQTIRTELGLGDEDFVIGLCARVDPMKDHGTFVDAAKFFAAEVPEARFLLIGAGTDGTATPLDQMIVRSGIAKRFIRLGQRADVDRLLPALDVGTLSSAFGEGFPNVLAETMACGVPCVATDVGDSALIIGDTGLTVPPRDARGLAAAWKQICDEGREERAARGAAARRRVAENYSLNAVIQDHRDMYLELTA